MYLCKRYVMVADGLWGFSFLQWYCTGERLDRLLRRSLATGDELAWKLLHNLAVSGGQQVAQRLLVQAKGMLDLLQVSFVLPWCQRMVADVAVTCGRPSEVPALTVPLWQMLLLGKPQCLFKSQLGICCIC